MSASFEQAALLGAGSSGAHQQILGSVHGSGSGDMNPPVPAVIESNFRDGVYKINGSAVTIDEIWTGDASGSPWAGYTIESGTGLVKQGGTAPDYSASDFNSPFLKHELFGSAIDLASGFTMLVEGSAIYTMHDFVPGTYDTRVLTVGMGAEMADQPDYTTDWTMAAGPAYTELLAEGSPQQSEHYAEFNDAVDDQTDAITPLPASPMIIRLAVTFEADRVAFSLNGRPVQVSPAVLQGAAITDLNLIYTMNVSLFEVIAALEYVAFYPKFANDADLMTLTAP